MPINISCFKAYDIRGRIPDQLNDDIAYRIGNATAEFLKAKKMVVGRDMRLSSAELTDEVVRGLIDAGVEVLDIGLCGTEMVYFATTHLEADGGIMVTASHNPADYNGLKLVREEARPISADTGLVDIRKLAERDKRKKAKSKGSRHVGVDFRCLHPAHAELRRSHATPPLKLVVNAGNGCAGIAIDGLEKRLPFQFIKVHHEPDGTFPNGIPNPLLPENRSATIDAVIANKARHGHRLGRRFRPLLPVRRDRAVSSRAITSWGCWPKACLAAKPGGEDRARPAAHLEHAGHRGGSGRRGGAKQVRPFLHQGNHAKVDAIYGGEMSAHHYFRDFSYADSGMIPWLLVAELMSKSGKKLSALVGERQAKYPASGEINLTVADTALALSYGARSLRGRRRSAIDETDGISLEFDQWRFNLRGSNTEPVIRLNVESRGDEKLMRSKTQEILRVLDTMG